MLNELIYSSLWYRHKTLLCNVFLISAFPATQLYKLAKLPNKKEIVIENAAFILKTEENIKCIK